MILLGVGAHDFDQSVNIAGLPHWMATRICIEFMSECIRQTGGEGYMGKKIFQIYLKKSRVEKI